MDEETELHGSTSTSPESRRLSRTDQDEARQSRRERKTSSLSSSGKRNHRSHSRHRSESKRSKKHSRSSRKHSRHKRKKKRQRRHSSSSEYSDSSQSTSSNDSEDGSKTTKKRNVVRNEKLISKLDARGETLDERKARRAQKRAAKIQARFGYTAEDNPFNDPNLHETFTWNKKRGAGAPHAKKSSGNQDTIEEIELIRRRRKERELEREEMDRLRAEEARMKELENYDDWAKKEENFHLEQQRKRSAIRLVEGREKPVDVLAKNLLIFGLTDEEKNERAAIKYKERYNALDELQKLDAELEEPQEIVRILKLPELKELLVDINAFQVLEKETYNGNANETITRFWDALALVVEDEIAFLQNGGENSAYAKKVEAMKSIMTGQSRADLVKMKEEIIEKIDQGGRQNSASNGSRNDPTYWQSVMQQLLVYIAKMDLSKFHSKMLVRQLEQLENRKQILSTEQSDDHPNNRTGGNEDIKRTGNIQTMVPMNVEETFGNLEEELGLSDEVAVADRGGYAWQDRYVPRKPRYFNRVRTGFDWNKYNQTHYDKENPPPKIVQGYKFNVFYPDLIDPMKTPTYTLERADSNEFCILRFHAGPPYEDIAFKIVNREWNKSRKRGFRSTFERGVLSLYFNFTTHWYRR